MPRTLQIYNLWIAQINALLLVDSLARRMVVNLVRGTPPEGYATGLAIDNKDQWPAHWQRGGNIVDYRAACRPCSAPDEMDGVCVYHSKKTLTF